MFKFLKEKLKGFFKKSSEEIVREADAKEASVEAEKKQIEEEKVEKKYKEVEEKKPEDEKKGFFAKLKKKFAFKISEEIFEKFWSELEILLLENNVALEVVERIKKDLKRQMVGKEIEKQDAEKIIKDEVRKTILNLMVESFSLVTRIREGKKPYVMVFFGINGSGKTTAIAKIACLLKKHNLNCVLAASDTFRAASIEQLEKHASKLNVKVVKHGYGADAAAVAFDAISYAKAHNIDVVLIDTAGRMHTQANLMKEMEKICKVAKPDLKVFIGEAIVGNDMIEQAKSFLEAVGIDAIILSKVDVDEKGGAAISASYITKKPILFLGIGQKYNDLEIFDKEKIIERIGL